MVICVLSLCTLCLQAADFVVATAATMRLTFGGRRVGEVGPAPHCKAPVTATATVTGTAGVAAPTGNVTLAIASHSSLLDPIPHSLDMPPVRCGRKPAMQECASMWARVERAKMHFDAYMLATLTCICHC